LGEVLVSLCHDPSEGKLTITIKSAEGLQEVSRTGTMSMSGLLKYVFAMYVMYA
jgi:hypothetical protein